MAKTASRKNSGSSAVGGRRPAASFSLFEPDIGLSGGTRSSAKETFDQEETMIGCADGY
jgi:hypothetical protein